MDSAPTGLWGLLPPSLRTAVVIALVTSLVAGVFLYRDTVSSGRVPEFSRGGRFGGITEGRTAIDDLSIPTPDARSSGTVRRPRSSAVLTAPKPDEDDPVVDLGSDPQTPELGDYVYAIEGSEEATAFGSRDYPPEMTMTVHKSPADAEELNIEDDELVFDLNFSEDHEEREIVAFRPKGIAFTYEAGSITFGVTQTSEASYKPPMLQVPATLSAGTTVEGTSRARSPGGEVMRIEDWTVTVVGRETLEVMGEAVPTWIVQIDRQSRPESSDQVTRTRRYWFSPTHSIWVKWEETFEGSRDFGPGSFTYSTEFTATLDRIEPLAR